MVGLLLVTAAVAAPWLVTRGDAAPAQRFKTEACPASFTTGTCLGGTFVNGTDASTEGADDAEPPAEEVAEPPADDGDGGEEPVVPVGPTAEEVQQQLVMEANTYFRQPDVAVNAGLDPDVQLTSTVNVATFIEVTNWQGQQVDRYEETDAGGSTYYVEITSTPHLFFDPGEPNAPRIPCEDGGTRYDPDDPGDAEEQAERPGACAYAYRMRTGVDGRPDAWPAEVVIEWSVSWSANFDLPDDLPTSATLSEPVPREVQEINSVVVDD